MSQKVTKKEKEPMTDEEFQRKILEQLNTIQLFLVILAIPVVLALVAGFLILVGAIKLPFTITT